ncbi:MAG: MCE family protein [bacterium]|nr:MCE family protein [bacterium]
MARRNINEFRVGLFVVVPVAVLLLFILFKLGYSVATSTMDVYLKVDNLTSIKKGTPIMIKGYTIGRVVEVKPVYKPALHFLATMRIQKDIELSEDCSAVIQNQNVIGDPSIEFKNPERVGNLLLAGDVIEGIEYVNLEAILQDVHNLLVTLSSTANTFKQLSLDSRDNLRRLLTNLADSGDNLNKILASAQTDVIAILGSFRKTAKTMNEISVELKKHPVKFLFKDED